ncbi:MULTISPECIES: DUF445 domain-containing protein [unclassified Streptomyces]|uniref:DUF445 domain-containing protein n=1 Tax=unclassified Streptomyces TaxID=2593676 RepID=UPI00381F066E
METASTSGGTGTGGAAGAGSAAPAAHGPAANGARPESGGRIALGPEAGDAAPTADGSGPGGASRNGAGGGGHGGSGGSGGSGSGSGPGSAPRGRPSPRGGLADAPGGAAAEEERRRGLRRMKLIATGFLLVATVVYALAKWADSRGAGGWAGYVAAAAEAGMVGALADWFAVTALFRRPLGLPIPHTAIIPTKKDALGASLGDFVGENFLSAEVVRTRLRAVGIGTRLGGWLSEPANADKVTEQAAAALRGMFTVLRDSDVQAVVSEAITRRAEAQEVAPGLGKMLERIVADGGHRRMVDLVCVRAHDWLVEHGDSVMDAVQGGAPGWTPRFVDRKVGERVYKELLRFVTEMRDSPGHPARGAVDRFLGDFAVELQSDPDTRARVERLKRDLLARGEVQDLIASVWGAVRTMMVAAAEDERSELRMRARASLLSLGRKLATDPRLQEKVDVWLEDAATYLVTTYRDEITSLISETVAGWDADQTSRKIENHVGRDLQFIRINGTVVGALAGLAIFAISRLAGG